MLQPEKENMVISDGVEIGRCDSIDHKSDIKAVYLNGFKPTISEAMRPNALGDIIPLDRQRIATHYAVNFLRQSINEVEAILAKSEKSPQHHLLQQLLNEYNADLVIFEEINNQN